MKFPSKEVIGTLGIGAILGGVPWVAIQLIKNGVFGMPGVVTGAVFVAVAMAVTLQWWLIRKESK